MLKTQKEMQEYWNISKSKMIKLIKYGLPREHLLDDTYRYDLKKCENWLDVKKQKLLRKRKKKNA